MSAERALEASREVVEEALDRVTIDKVLESLLGADPPPYVIACSEHGLCVPLPADVPVLAAHAITGIGSPLELCMPADLGPIVEAWERARRTNGAQVAVHLRTNPEHAVTAHFVDARYRYGVYLCIIVGKSASSNGEAQPASLFRPRLGTMQRNELSIVLSIDEASSKILGWTAAELVGQRMTDLIHPDDKNLAIANWMAMLGRQGAEHRVVMRYRHRDGNYIWFEISHRNLLNDPAYRCVMTEMVDISERMEAVEALRANEQLLRRLTEALPLGIVQIDRERHSVYQNERLSGILGVASATTFDEQFANAIPADRLVLETALDELLRSAQPADIELTIVHVDGRRRCSVGMRPLSTEGGAVTGAILCVADITERVRMRDELERRAKYDTLTHCHNRASILEALDSAVQAPQRPGTGMAVLFVDLDHFKEVNDRYGHAAGDELLRHTGARLLHSVRDGDIVGRLGGDEFLIVCPQVVSPARALEIARRIGAALTERVHVGAISLLPGSSIGVAWTTGPIDTDSFVASADAAMYESKRGDHSPVLHLAPESRVAGIA